ncbi:MAG: helix-turn-helix transcriptional regulator [Devosia nanyangense]|uniref:Helix-turn-helix transcriptional regulator n=1 Tax=Devosia nanyangense TaxID=1228055 RepID=A0A933P093_9HYPH|nr:helix-turn-helix transcriptional regulator [Devosia nanyangense]
MRLTENVVAPNVVDAGDMLANARRTTDFLKSLAHEGRLVILCRLSEGPATVTELEQVLGARQSSVSQQLARLRSEGLVDYERDGRILRYSIADDRARKVVAMLYDLFCD